MLDEAVTHTYKTGEARDTTSSKFRQIWTKKVKDVKLLESHEETLLRDRSSTQVPPSRPDENR